MSSQGGRRRCIIQKLDFENCIITNIKTTARGRKKLRARITREIETIPDDPEKPSSSQPQNKKEQTNNQPKPQAQGSTSPVLIKKQSRDGGSPVLMKRKKANFPEENQELSGDSTIEEIYSSPGSPVFKMNKKPKTGQDIQNVLGRMTSMDILSQGNSSSVIQIEEFTQESKTSVKISSVESSDVKNDSVYSIDSDAVGLNISCVDSIERLSDSFNARESPKSFRRNYKKNSLLGRLQKLQQKRASEKLLWQHQNRKNSSSCLKFSIVSFWKEEFYYFLKCRSIPPESETNFLIVDSRWVPNIKNITKGSILQLHPPWQKLQVDNPSINVLLSIICLDILEETEEPILQNRTFESVPVLQFETDHKIFVHSLFSAGSCENFW